MTQTCLSIDCPERKGGKCNADERMTQTTREKCYCHFGYCDATPETPCFCQCHPEKPGCWTCECN